MWRSHQEICEHNLYSCDYDFIIKYQSPDDVGIITNFLNLVITIDQTDSMF